MYQPVLFKDRFEAGKKLGKKLKKLKFKKDLILAIPAGGVPIGKEVAKILNCPFDLLIVRKIQFPWTTEAGFGAVSSNGSIYLGPDSKLLPKAMITKQTKKTVSEVKKRSKKFLKGKKELDLKGKIVIIVDDGLAAGSTMIAAIKSVKKKKPKEIIVAVPTASKSAVELIRPKVDKLISFYIHPKNLSYAVASSYEKWHDLSDKEVKDCLRNT